MNIYSLFHVRRGVRVAMVEEDGMLMVSYG